MLNETTTTIKGYLYTQQPLILDMSLLSLGLLVAVYTLVYPQIQNILKKNIHEILKLGGDFEEKSKELSKSSLKNEERKKKTEELNTINNNIDYAYELPFELYYGFIICMVLFSIPLIIYSFDFFGINKFTFLYDSLTGIFFLGVILFVVLFFLIFLRLNSLVREEFDTAIQNSRKTKKGKSK